MSVAMLIIALAGSSAHNGSLRYDGMYVESCSCPAPCPCELTGISMGCEGVGAFSIASGRFEGADLSGVKFAYATKPGSWVQCYVDAPTKEKRAAGAALAKSAFKDWGKMGAVKDAKIDITGSAGKYTMMVDGGKIMALTTSPVNGLNKKKPMTYSNINSVLHPVVMQAKTVKCAYHDGDKKFDLKGTNAYYNPTIKANGKLGR